MHNDHADAFSDLPRLIPVPAPDGGGGVTHKPREVCSKAEVYFYLGYMMYRIQARARAAQQWQQAMVDRFGRAPAIPTLQYDDGSTVQGLPDWISTDYLPLYAQLAQEEGLQMEDEGA